MGLKMFFQLMNMLPTLMILIHYLGTSNEQLRRNLARTMPTGSKPQITMPSLIEFKQHLLSVILLIGAGTFRIHSKALEYTSFGKPHPFVFKNAETVLKKLQQTPYYLDVDGIVNNGETGCQTFRTLYMVGDNPSVDIKGARQAGHPWYSILTRTGVFKGKGNHEEFPADMVVDTVEDAVDYILRRECIS